MQQKVKTTARVKQWALSEGIDLAVRSDRLRGWIMEKGRKRLKSFFADDNPHGMPERVREMRYIAINNLLGSYDRALSDGRIGASVRRKFVKNFVGQVMTGEQDRIRPYKEKYGEEPPTFLVISPTQVCNLTCRGCYADSHNRSRATLPHAVFQRVLDDKRRSWGSHFTVISGGEPMMYRSAGQTILDVFEHNRQDYHLMYTNGTMLTRETARRLAELGNVTPAISVEGGEQETDARRGKGTYRKLLSGMENLRAEGVPFGISITAMRHNAELVMSREFVDYWFREQGAVHGWVFQYMPIGRSITIDDMITPEQRQWMLDRQHEVLYEDGHFLVDFWNGGPMSEGCLAGGRGGGYLYVNWNGDVTPCVFFPYAAGNVKELYAEGRDLTSVIQGEFFASLRKWQNGYLHGGKGTQNLFTPCPIRDHYKAARAIIDHHQPTPIDEAAAAALGDPRYKERMIEVGCQVGELLDPVWGEGGEECCGILQPAVPPRREPARERAGDAPRRETSDSAAS